MKPTNDEIKKVVESTRKQVRQERIARLYDCLDVLHERYGKNGVSLDIKVAILDRIEHIKSLDIP